VNVGILSIVGIGFLGGFRHAFEPDHVAAVTTLATREMGWSHAARLGVAWGVGHTASVALVAMALIVVGVRVPDGFYRAAEMLVALLLILLGLSSLRAEARGAEPRGTEGGAVLLPSRSHTGSMHRHDAPVRFMTRSLWFGVAHGMAGSGTVVVLLVAAATTTQGRLGYLATFGVGTIVGMSVVSLLTGAVSAVAAARNLRVAHRIRTGAALASIVVGVFLAWRVLSGA
jgi:high-affinity nickel-transport protein